VTEGAKLGLEVTHSRDGSGSGIVVTNYERLHYFDSSKFGGVVCDESSILKNFKGSTCSEVIAFMRKTPYRLLCTATAAPNDYIELGTSSEALGELGNMDMLSKFFKLENNSVHGLAMRASQKYRFRGHAEHDFWRWICSWARACRKPSDLGFDDNGFVLPELCVAEHTVVARTLPNDLLFEMPAINLQEQRAELRRTINERCEKAAEVAWNMKEPSISWCNLNDEGKLLRELIPGSVEVSGSDSEEFKEEAFKGFANGDIQKLISKPRIAGFGLNWQHCAHATFFLSHSYEQYYQAIRRCLRFGQKRNVQVDLISTEGQSGVLKNIQRKTHQAEKMFDFLVKMMWDEMNIKRENNYTKKEILPSWL
jgi:hypothetical protein